MIAAFKKAIPLLTVILFAFYPILASYSFNASELDISQLWLPLGASLLVAGIFYFLWLVIFRDYLKASIATAVLMFFMLNYGMLFSLTEKFLKIQHWHFLPLIIFIYIHILLIVIRIKEIRVLKNINIIMIIPICLLVLYNIGTIALLEYQKGRSIKNDNFIQDSGSIAKHGSNNQNIIIIILDECASTKTISEEYGYDNSTFNLSLRSKGFFIAENSLSRTTATEKSMPALVNFEYMDPKATDIELYEKFNDNHLFNSLSRAGYRIYFIDSFDRSHHKVPTQNVSHMYIRGMDFDEQYDLDQFTYLIFSQSILSHFIILKQGETSNEYYLSNKYIFDYLEKFPSNVEIGENPYLLFAHINCPHMPYVFDREGNYCNNPTNYFEHAELDPETLKSLYFEQYLFSTKKISEVVETILSSSKVPPVILLQSDHGPRKPSTGIESEIQHHRVLNAIYFPDKEYSTLYDSIAPVNTMRVLLNKYFNQKYEMLEDR